MLSGLCRGHAVDSGNKYSPLGAGGWVTDFCGGCFCRMVSPGGVVLMNIYDAMMVVGALMVVGSIVWPDDMFKRWF